MTIQRIGTTEGMQAIPGIKVMPIISFAVVHNGMLDLCGVTAEPEGDVKVQTKKVLGKTSTSSCKWLALTSRNCCLLKYGWQTCRTSMIIIQFGTIGLIARIPLLALVSVLPCGDPAFWSKSR